MACQEGTEVNVKTLGVVSFAESISCLLRIKTYVIVCSTIQYRITIFKDIPIEATISSKPCNDVERLDLVEHICLLTRKIYLRII